MADDSLASCGAAVTMAGPDDEDTFAERLLNFPRAIFRWASQAVVQPGATDCAAGAAATNFASAMISISKSVGTTANTPHHNEVSWLGSGGRYDLLFVRPAGTRTDPSAALADRTCVTCGATYRSELAVACAHCGAERALPWGRWRLADAAPV